MYTLASRFCTVDGGGSISVIEFISAFRSIAHRLGPEFQHPGPMKLFAKIDTDKSGDINLEEFIDGVCCPQINDINLIRILTAVGKLTDNSLVQQTERRMSLMTVADRRNMEEELDANREQSAVLNQNSDAELVALKNQLSAVRTRMARDESRILDAVRLNEQAAIRIMNLQKALDEYEDQVDQEEELSALRSQIKDMKQMLNARKNANDSNDQVANKSNDSNNGNNGNNGNDGNDGKDELIRQLQLENNMLKRRLEELKNVRTTNKSHAHLDTKQNDSTVTTILAKRSVCMKPTHSEDSMQDDRRRIVAMLSVMKEQVKALRQDVDMKRRVFALDPESNQKRSMVRQYSKRLETECAKVRDLERELGLCGKDHFNSSKTRKNNQLASRSTRLSHGASSTTMSPRYRNPNQYHIKGKRAEQQGMMFSNFNRKERFGWQVAGKDTPSPSQYRPKHETCQDRYEYQWDEDPNGRKARKDKQVTLLKARNRRGSTLSVYREKPDEHMGGLAALEDAPPPSNNRHGNGRSQDRLETQLSNSTRRASIAQVNHNNSERIWKSKHETCTLELVQTKHRYDTLNRTAVHVIRALDEYLYPDDSNNAHLEKNVRSVVIPSHTLRMLIGVGEPNHIKMLRNGGQYNRSLRHVSDRGYSDPRMGKDYQFMSPRGSMLEGEERGPVNGEDDEEGRVPLPPPPTPPPIDFLLAPPPSGPRPLIPLSPTTNIDNTDNTRSAELRARRTGHMRAHSALDIQGMPLGGVMRFLFRLYTTTEQSDDDKRAGRYTIKMSNILRMLRDANLYSSDFHWSHVTTLFDSFGGAGSNAKLDWVGYTRVFGALADLKYADDKSGIEKLQRRYLRPLAISIVKNNRLKTPSKSFDDMLDGIHSPRFLQYTNDHEDTLKSMFLRIQRDNKNHGVKRGKVGILMLKEFLKESKLMPQHVTGGVVSKIVATVTSDRTILTDTKTFTMMAGNSEADNAQLFGFVEFMEFMALVGFCSYGSLVIAGGGDVTTSWHDLQATNDQRLTLQSLLLQIDRSYLEAHESEYMHEGDSIPLAVVPPPGLSNLSPRNGGDPPGISRPSSPTSPSSTLNRPSSEKFHAKDLKLQQREMLTREDMQAQDRYDRVQDAFTHGF